MTRVQAGLLIVARSVLEPMEALAQEESLQEQEEKLQELSCLPELKALRLLRVAPVLYIPPQSSASDTAKRRFSASEIRSSARIARGSLPFKASFSAASLLK